MTKYLITASLYNAYAYYALTDFEQYGEKADEIEAKARQDFLDTLNKVKKEPSEAMLKGIEFENAVYANMNGEDIKFENAKEVAAIIKSGFVQEKLCFTIDDYVFYGIADVVRIKDIIDIKRVSKYECPKYDKSIQHLLYLEAFPIENFTYLISDGSNLYEEYYHKDLDNRQKLLSKTNNMVGFIRQTPEFNEAFEKNWHSQY